MAGKRWKRAVFTVAVFLILYMLFPLLLKAPAYDIYAEALRILTATIGAGFFWVGSRAG